jgi:hypothetical protein
MNTSNLVLRLNKIMNKWMMPSDVRYYEKSEDIHDLERRMKQVQRGQAPFQQHTHSHIGKS